MTKGNMTIRHWKDDLLKTETRGGNNKMKVKNIEIRLEELDRMESQILFSVSILSADDHVRLARIKEERAELKAKLKKMNEKKDK